MKREEITAVCGDALACVCAVTLAFVCAVLLAVTVGCSRHANSGRAADSSPSPAPAAAGAGDAAQAVAAQAVDGARPVLVSVEGTDAAEPAVASGHDGTAYVAWVEHRGKEADVLLARVGADGRPQGTPARVNTEAGTATAWRGDPPTVAAAPDGTLYVGWTARAVATGGQAVKGGHAATDGHVATGGQAATTGAHGNELYLSASHDGGRTFAPPVKVNDDRELAVHGMHSLAVAADGRVHVAWLDERNTARPQPSALAEGHHMESNREVFAAYSIDRGRTFSPNRRVATDACPCCKTTLALGAEGRLYVGWRQVLPGDFRHIAVAASVDGGQTFAPGVIVSDDRWQIAGCPVSGPALAVGDDGALRVLWYSEGEAGETGLYWSESRDGGLSFTPRRPFAKNGARGTPVLTSDERRGLVAVWEGGGDSARPLAARLSEDGAVVGDAAATTEGGQLPAANVTGGQLFVAYVKDAGGAHGVWLARAPMPGT
jgi:hypothetical protein